MVALGRSLNPGEISEAYTLDIEAPDAQDYVRWFVYVDDTGISNECDEEDNKLDFDLSEICWEAVDSGETGSDSGNASDSGTSGNDSGADTSPESGSESGTETGTETGTGTGN